ncbi:MAG: hypothetical protein ACHQ4J_07205 [Candidatus Binatia bacterium]
MSCRTSGIVLDSSNFSAYQFTFGIGTSSNQVAISFDVTFPQDAAVDTGGDQAEPIAGTSISNRSRR